MKTNKKHSTNNKALTGFGSPNFGSKLKSRSEQLSGNENRNGNGNGQTAPAPAPDNTLQVGTSSTSSPISTAPTRTLPYVNYEERQKSRSLSSEEVLEHLRRWYPQAYDLAEIVGKWVWVTFPHQPAETLRAGLSQIGFHWNNVRKCWQHPCGQFTTTGTSHDPREKYGSHFAADLRAA